MNPQPHSHRAHDFQPPVCDYEGSDYQSRFWEEADRGYEDQVEAVALARLLPEGGNRLLEVGAGAGRNTGRYPGFGRVVLLDYSHSQLKQARERLDDGPGHLYVVGDAYFLPFADEAFDAATMLRTFHHIAEPAMALRSVRRTLRERGVFILEYANKRNLKAIVRWLARRQDWNPFDPAPVEFVELNFDFHPAAVRGWLADAGFEVGRELTVSHFRMEWLKQLIPTRILVGLDSLLQPTAAWFQLTPSVFVRSEAAAEKREQTG